MLARLAAAIFRQFSRQYHAKRRSSRNLLVSPSPLLPLCIFACLATAGCSGPELAPPSTPYNSGNTNKIIAMHGSSEVQWTYTVRPQDKTMADVAYEVYGNPAFARHISAANPFASPDNLAPGQKLAIPVLMGPEGKATYPRRCDGTPVYRQ